MKIGLLAIATGRYVELVNSMLASARRYFFTDERVTPFVFTDSPAACPDAVALPIAHEPWPFVTLKRYHYFSQYAATLREMDYLFYVDVDMRFVARCADEILPTAGQGLVVAEHPAFYRGHRGIGSRFIDACTGGRWSSRPLPHKAFPFERDPRSLACISDTRHCAYYYGGFNGGETSAFLSMASTLRDAVDDDLARGVIAVWHDESHLNRYVCDRAPKRLPPSYCYPESGYPHLRHLKPVIMALDKDHAYFRYEAQTGSA